MNTVDQPVAKVAKLVPDELTKIPIFSRFTKAELAQIINLGVTQVFPGNTNIVIEGEKSTGLYLVLSGQLSVHRNNPSTGKMHRIAFLENGDWFGEFSLFDDGPRTATVISDCEIKVYFLDGTVFLDYLEKNGDSLKSRFYETCAKDLAMRFKKQNAEFIQSQHLLWQHALRREEKVG